MNQLSLPVPEVEPSPCLWPYISGSEFPVYYKWGSGLTLPGSLWRLAFEFGSTQWNYVEVKPVFIFDQNASTVVETYDDPLSGNRGITTFICAGPIGHLLPTDVKIRGNVALDTQDHYSINQRRGIAAHEVGHGTLIDHIPNSYSWPALMHEIMDLPDFEVINVPQPADIALVNQKYP
ncbi:MAG TPA: hypothetical protein PJ988_11575 [Anaerolinea sp.]|nr:hypothetical protein [Anaerolinea sp.]